MKRVLRVLTVALAIMLVLALVPASAFAAPEGKPSPSASQTAAERAKSPPQYNWHPSLGRADYVQTHVSEPGVFKPGEYHKYADVLLILEKWAADYPDLVSLYSVSKSYLGVDIWQITITNKNTGIDTEKPAMWVGGNRHAGEVTAREAALYFAWNLLENYGTDPEITHLVDTRAFYVKPMENPDGAELYLTTPQTIRSTVRPNDDNRDGIPDSDPLEDFNGDGYRTQMRKYVGEGNGTHSKDPRDPLGRIMISGGARDYVVRNEGIDNDGDGSQDNDGVGGLDLHRNYPVNWRPMELPEGEYGYTQSGAGEYPLSEPEILSNYQWLLTHPNISIVNSMDTSTPMHLRPPSTTHPEEGVFDMDEMYYDYFDTTGKALSGYSKAGDVYHTYSNGRDSALFGHGPDFGYFGYGSIWYGDEIWGYTDYIEDYNGDGRIDSWDALWMNDNDPELTDLIFIPWTPFQYDGQTWEAGGFNPKFWSQNPPAGDWLELTQEKQNAFNMMLATSLPLITVSDPIVAPTSTAGQYTVTATIQNEGFLPDALKEAYQIKIVRPGTASISVSEGMSIVGTNSRTLGFFAGEFEDNDDYFAELSNQTWKNEPVTYTWTVKGSGTVTVLVRSTRGGTVSKTVTIP